MNDCERLSDRMPEVSLGRSLWTPEEAAHLEGCAECAAEWRLVTAAAALDPRRAVVSDSSAIAAAVQRRLASDRAGRARRVRLTWVTGAAAAALLAVLWSEREPQAGAEPIAAVADADAIMPLPELEGLETVQLDTLLRSLDRPFAGSSTLDASTLGEHEEGELEQAFTTWEG